jgi:hypothetical protein
MGINDIEDDPGVAVDSPGGGPQLFFQQVPEAKVAKNRVHLDLRAADREGEVQRLIALGATRLRDHTREDGAGGWTVLQDPEGNEFCVID